MGEGTENAPLKALRTLASDAQKCRIGQVADLGQRPGLASLAGQR
jgi:hypothetical protein